MPNQTNGLGSPKSTLTLGTTPPSLRLFDPDRPGLRPASPLPGPSRNTIRIHGLEYDEYVYTVDQLMSLPKSEWPPESEMSYHKNVLAGFSNAPQAGGVRSGILIWRRPRRGPADN